MSKFKELIEELCPDGVQYVSVGELCSIQTGSQLNKETLKDVGEYPVYNGGINPSGYHDEFNTEANTIAISQGGASAGFVNWVDVPFFAGAHCYTIKNVSKQILNRYLYFYLKNEQDNIQNSKRGAGIPGLNSKAIKNLRIPLPPLIVQQEVVQTLDIFTELTSELTAELTAELTMRKKQYEYYRDELFGRDYDEMLKRAEDKNIQIVTMEELGSFTRGKRFVRNDIREEGVPCIHYGDLYTHYGVSAEKTKCFLDEDLSKKMRFAQRGDVVIVQAGENDMDIGIGVAWMGNEDVAVHDACYIFKHDINPKYISHYLRTSIYHLQIKKYVSIGKICAINAQGIGKALIPIPSLEEQQRIVAILDRFDTLCNDLTSSLPAEIEARRKQYEYYRDKLLTFREASA